VDTIIDIPTFAGGYNHRYTTLYDIAEFLCSRREFMGYKPNFVQVATFPIGSDTQVGVPKRLL
jgi:hypothetical protein